MKPMVGVCVRAPQMEEGAPSMAEFRCCFDVTRQVRNAQSAFALVLPASPRLSMSPLYPDVPTIIQPLCFAGLDSRVWEANSALCTLLGYTRLEITGLSIFSVTLAYQVFLE